MIEKQPNTKMEIETLEQGPRKHSRTIRWGGGMRAWVQVAWNSTARAEQGGFLCEQDDGAGGTMNEHGFKMSIKSVPSSLPAGG